MRIKTYDFNTISKLKNPLRDFDNIYSFVEENFNLKSINHDKSKTYYFKDIAVDLTDDEILFFNNYNEEDNLGGYTGISKYLNKKTISNTFFIYSVYKYNTPYIYNKDRFAELKDCFLNCVLNKELNKNLIKRNNTTKTKI